ncbi:MAG: hypothetical protein MMC33_008125 [Icmadophila ericetorum]|nr:hypothetical protein [Icmadophila ericetorum]
MDSDPITIHVLDSVTGLPAANVNITLALINPIDSKPLSFHALTASSGRISRWTASAQGAHSLQELISDRKVRVGGLGRMIWSLKVDTLAYWGEGKTFYPEVEVKFFVGGVSDDEKIETGNFHIHVPLILGPWGYTTYRGS